jgi:hypothetical protein
VAQGGKTLIVQWSAYGDSDFGGSDGWLANSLRARAQGLQLVLGLYMDPAYYQRLEELDGEGLNNYFKAQLGRSLSQYQHCAMTGSCRWKAGTCPWNWTTCTFAMPSAARRCTASCRPSTASWTSRCTSVRSAPGSCRRASTAPGWISWPGWADVWWQDGAGTGRLPPLVRQGYEQALPCRVGIVREAFRQVSAPGQAFAPSPRSPS